MNIPLGEPCVLLGVLLFLLTLASIVAVLLTNDQPDSDGERDGRQEAHKSTKVGTSVGLRKAESPITPSEHLQTNDNIGERTYHLDERRYRIERFTLFGLLAYVVINAFILCAQLDANRLNQESLTSVQRAFLFPSTSAHQGVVEKVKQAEMVRHYRLYWLFENSGTTPAREVMALSLMTYSPTEEMPEDYRITETPLSKKPEITTIPPRATVGLAIGDISPSDFANIAGQTRRFYIWGSIGYRDVFPNSELHVTEFCAGIENVPSNWNDATKERVAVEWTGCGEHNCADTDCPDYEEKKREYLDMEQTQSTPSPSVSPSPR